MQKADEPEIEDSVLAKYVSRGYQVRSSSRRRRRDHKAVLNISPPPSC